QKYNNINPKVDEKHKSRVSSLPNPPQKSPKNKGRIKNQSNFTDSGNYISATMRQKTEAIKLC
ncbi:MAG: hypothetical protein IKN45_07370, partial [Lachnospiraceae bacterium]|nr:hypothetical protein [Lachnospiraceae bacterium]